MLLKAQKRDSDHKAPSRASKHHKISNCAPVNSPVEHAGEEQPGDASPKAVTFFQNDLESAGDDLSPQACNLGQTLKTSQALCIRSQEMFPIEERDDEVEEEDRQEDREPPARTPSGAASGGNELGTPVKAFPQLGQSEEDELRVTSGRPKSPLKPLGTFHVSPPPRDARAKSEALDRADGQEAHASHEDGHVSPLNLETSSEALVVHADRQGSSLEAANKSGDRDHLTARHDSMAYSASVSTIERSKTDRPHHKAHLDDQSKSSADMLCGDDCLAVESSLQ